MDPVSNACEKLFDSTGGRLLVAFSGGMDSMVLAHAVAGAARRRDALERVRAVHVDHGLNEDSARWAVQCAERIADLQIGFESHTLALDPGSNLEARARAARYRIFATVLESDDLLLLAHHAGDQTESLLLHLFQGRGLYGMPASRALGAGRLMRPFLELPRATLAGYARSHHLSWIEDPSNADLSLDRNFLRHRLLPELLERFEGLSMRLSQVAQGIADTGTALDELAGLDRHPLPLEVFDGLSQPARLALLRRWLTGKEVTAGVTRSALTEFLRQLDAGNDRQPALGLPNGRVLRYRRALHLVGPAPELEPFYPLTVPGRLSLPHGTMALQPIGEADSSDAAARAKERACIRLQGPVSVTFLAGLEPGARMRRGGHHRSVRTLMREAGVPPWLRESQPIVCDEQGAALIPGVAARDQAPVGEASASAGTLTEVRWSGEVH